MSNSFFRKLIKILLFALILLERYNYYKDLKTVETEITNSFYETILRLKVDYGKLHDKYNEHSIFFIPYTRGFVENLKTIIENKTSLNETITHTTSEDKNFSSQTFEDKFMFSFLLSYDLIVVTIFLLACRTNSIILNILLISEYALKIFSVLFLKVKEQTVIFIINHMYTNALELLTKDVMSIKEDTLNFFQHETILGLQLLITVLLLFWLFLTFVNALYQLVYRSIYRKSEQNVKTSEKYQSIDKKVEVELNNKNSSTLEYTSHQVKEEEFKTIKRDSLIGQERKRDGTPSKRRKYNGNF